MAKSKDKKLYYSYSGATQELMITTVSPDNLDKVENIMLDTDHFLQWDPKQKEVVGFFTLFVDPDEKEEKFHSLPLRDDLKNLDFANFFKKIGTRAKVDSLFS